ncbi:MAG: 23S rRNA (adenine(2503)-C(2))-methyltransferase RlmN [Phycisphaerales bacterium]|nr:23S rRNA (adenine(2503)-C(2))-methyltransferase RlmN [Phycisphaerales bacterium]
MRHPEHHIFHHTPESLAEWCGDRGMPAFRAKQVLKWVYERGVVDPEQMTDLSKRDRETLDRQMAFLSGPTVAHQLATDGTQKLLIEWPDDLSTTSAEHATVDTSSRLPIIGQDMPYSNTERQTECVMIPWPPKGSLKPKTDTRERRTACISSQVGCPVGCKFCASGLGGLDGNLSAGRIVEQVWRLTQLNDVERISNVVFMGMGEPLANFKNVLHAVRTLSAPWGMGIGARRITISTVGLPQAIERLARELDLPVTLALSLHAPTDELRRQLIPWAEHATIDQLLTACQGWFQKTGREVTLEYILLRGVNDRTEHAHLVADLARQMRANINLIRYNEVSGLPFDRPRNEDVRAFQDVLTAAHITTHVRASRGRDIAAACGQLRHEQAGAGA